MIYIEKEGLSASVEKCIIELCKGSKWKSLAADDTDAIRKVFDDDFPKSEVKKVLVHEQHGLCAYCMKRIRVDNHSRVEHWKPLSEDKEKALDYHNMLGVCDGGEKASGQLGRILCCDAHKGEQKISISPLNKGHMDGIAYKSDGTIYTESRDANLEHDINEVLLLNGIRKKDGSFRDTSTELVKGRRDAYERSRRIMDKLNQKGQCTSAVLKKIIDSLCEGEEYEEFVGVKLYYFAKKYDSLVRRGL